MKPVLRFRFLSLAVIWGLASSLLPLLGTPSLRPNVLALSHGPGKPKIGELAAFLRANLGRWV